MEKFDELEAKLKEAKLNCFHFRTGYHSTSTYNKKAGIRLRKNINELTNLVKEIREEIED